MDIQLEVTTPPTPASNGHSPTSPYLLEVRDLVKVYSSEAGDVMALKGVSMGVHRGEFVVVRGKSGAGKSTLANLITGIDRPTSGEIIIDGTEIHALSEDDMARWRGENMGIVFQFFQLLPSLTLIENVTIAMDFRNTFPLKERRVRAVDLLTQVGLADHVYKRPAKISGGQQQRVAVARALANDPQIIVADEPTGNLDSNTADEILRLFESLVERGKSLLLVTHDDDIAARATRVIEIADGLIVDGASHVRS